MSVSQQEYLPGTRVRVTYNAQPFLARVVEDDPANSRVRVRIETPTGVMHAYAMTTYWVLYEHVDDCTQ